MCMQRFKKGNLAVNFEAVKTSCMDTPKKWTFRRITISNVGPCHTPGCPCRAISKASSATLRDGPGAAAKTQQEWDVTTLTAHDFSGCSIHGVLTTESNLQMAGEDRPNSATGAWGSEPTTNGLVYGKTCRNPWFFPR